MKRILPVLAGVAIVAVALFATMGKRSPVAAALTAALRSQADNFDFVAQTSFEWTRMHVFGPYSSHDEIEQRLGARWPGVRQTAIESLDSIVLVVFVDGKRVVHWFEFPRGRGELGSLVDDAGYAPADARFHVDRQGDVPVLRRR